MDERTLSRAGTLSLDAARRIDQRCAQFEARLRQGEQPAIEGFLDLPSRPERRASLRELLVLELEYRRQRGEQPNLADYQSRFADDADVVADAFASRLASATSTQTFAAGSETADHDPAARPLRTAASADVLPRSFGPYLLEREIARGGMGIVYQAKRAGSDRPLALKMVLSGAVASRTSSF